MFSFLHTSICFMKVNKVQLLFAFITVFHLVVATAVLAVDIIYPEDGTYISHSNFLIIKNGEKPVVDAVTIEINGAKSGLLDVSSPEYKAIFADFLILEPELAIGENGIKVEAYSQGRVVGSSVAKVFLRESLFSLPPAGFRPFIMHIPQKEQLCSPCHDMSPSMERLSESSAEKNPCASCHKRMLDKKNVHGPAGVFRCAYCHDSSSKPSKYKSRNGDSGVCSECHLDKVTQFAKSKFIHGPVAVNMCSVCHDPHASDYTAQLLEKTNVVCLSCHDSLDVPKHFTHGVGFGHPVDGVPDPRFTDKELSCASCHNPHGGATKKYFPPSVTTTMSLCQKCHRK